MVEDISRLISVFLVLIFVLTSSLVPEATAGSITCNKESIKICYSKLGNSSYLLQPIPYATNAELTNFCKRFESFSICYTPVRSKCLNELPLMTVALLEGDYASHGFQCREGAEDYAKSKKCFSNSHLQKDSRQCTTTLNKQLASAFNESDSSIRIDKLCVAGNIYIGCINNYVDVFCKDDKTASKWIQTFNTKSLHPLFSAFVCPGFESTTTPNDDTDSPRVSIMIGVLVGLFCIVIIIALVLLLFFLVKNKYHRNITCLNSLIERFRNKPPPYLPRNNDLPMTNTSKRGASTEQNSNDNALQINEDVNQDTNQSYVERYVNDISEHTFSSLSHLPYKSSMSSLFANKSPSSSHDSPDKNTYKSTHSQSGFKGRCSEVSVRNMASEVSRDSAVSCTSTPSSHFEPPTNNPFSKVLSISNSDLDDFREQDYY